MGGCRNATLVSWTRELTSSLVKTERRCVDTVFVEMNNAAAAERLVCPSAISRATLTSFAVSDCQPNRGRSSRFLDASSVARDGAGEERGSPITIVPGCGAAVAAVVVGGQA